MRIHAIVSAIAAVAFASLVSAATAPAQQNQAKPATACEQFAKSRCPSCCTDNCKDCSKCKADKG